MPEAKATSTEDQIAALERRIAEKRASAKAAREQAARVQHLADLEAIAKAQDELGEQGLHFSVLETPLGVIILKRPHEAMMRRFNDAGLSKQGLRAAALDQLLRPSIVHPSLDRYDEIVKEFPGFSAIAANRVYELAGRAKEESDEE